MPASFCFIAFGDRACKPRTFNLDVGAALLVDEIFEAACAAAHDDARACDARFSAALRGVEERIAAHRRTEPRREGGGSSSIAASSSPSSSSPPPRETQGGEGGEEGEQEGEEEGDGRDLEEEEFLARKVRGPGVKSRADRSTPT